MLGLWQQAFGADHVLMDYVDPPANPSAEFLIDPVGWSARRPTALPEHIRVVHGHFRPQKYDLIKDVFRMTILRHPIDNIISIYFYWRAIPPQPNAVHQYFLKRKLSILELAKLPIMQNLYTDTYFGGWDMRGLDFIGCHENRIECISKLGKILGIRLDATLHLNKTSPHEIDTDRERIMNDKKTLVTLQKLLASDIAFYEKWVQN